MIYDSCDGRGCRVINLPHDNRINTIYSKVLRTKHDIQKILPTINIHLDEKLEKKR